MQYEVKFYKKNRYGHIEMYILDPEIAKAVALIAQRKTLSPNVKQGLELLGVVFVEVPAPL